MRVPAFAFLEEVLGGAQFPQYRRLVEPAEVHCARRPQLADVLLDLILVQDGHEALDHLCYLFEVLRAAHRNELRRVFGALLRLGRQFTGGAVLAPDHDRLLRAASLIIPHIFGKDSCYCGVRQIYFPISRKREGR